MTNRGLTVYRASAGSGKTFRLAMEYIKLLVAKPTAYKEILAVTFTNKATEEMKMRILSHLYGLWKGLPDSKVFMDTLLKELGNDATAELVSERAGTALRLILHDYHHMRVETIDAFFQRVLRGLSRELGLATGLTVEIGDVAAEQKAVDALIDGLKRNSALLGWMLGLVEEQMDEQRSFFVVDQVKDFGRNIFRDFYKEHAGKLNEVLSKKDFFSQYAERLKSMREQSKQKIIAYADAFEQILQREGLTIDDFSNGAKGVAGYFPKLRTQFDDDSKLLTKRVQAALAEQSASNWLTKTAIADALPIVNLVEQKLINLLNDAEEVRQKETRVYKSADLTLRHLNKLRLLGSIEQKVREMNGETNRFLLSDTQTLLHALMEDSDAPFIFEKIGTQIRHVMIDEFQDTSTVQWRNFKILLNECLSHSDSSGLIVGDVKQSIYRWRSGDWRLLNDIEEEFGDRQAPIKAKTLDTNFRSSRNIIEFNNAFFNLAAEEEQTSLIENGNMNEDRSLKKAYSHVTQHVPTDKPSEGYVQICLLPRENYEEETLSRLKASIEKLIEEGVAQEDIAILVRYNKTIEAIANRFTQEMPQLSFVSDEAFCIDSSIAVNMIIDALRLLVDQNDTMAAARLEKAQEKYLASQNENDQPFNLSALQLSNHLPLYELVEALYRDLNLQQLQNENAYICAFFDMVSTYLEDHTSDINAFLKSWDESLHEKTVQSDATHGIRLLTIHKSKGLEFDHVFMPFCDWELERRNTLIWCKPTESPYDELPIVPIDYSAKKMKGSIYEADYEQEHLQKTVDNLNLLYVAFTRAAKSLYVWAKKGDANGRSLLIEKTIEKLTSQLPSCIVTGDPEDKAAEVTLVYGSPIFNSKQEPTTKKSEEDSLNVFKQEEQNINIEIKNATTAPLQFRQSNQSRQFVEDLETEAQEGKEEESQYIKTGNILHFVFSSIRTPDDIDPTILRLESEGLLADLDMSTKSLSKLLHQRIEDPKATEWFAGKWKVYNECAIIWSDPNTGEVFSKRPDRVISDGDETIVIDFKFAKPTPAHRTQVQKYMGLLNSMGHQKVKGYLWYVFSNNIVEVS